MNHAIRHLPFFILLGAGKGDSVLIATEVRGLFGVPDLIAASISDSDRETKRSLAFEMKLSDWRRALVQAFRYKAFASTSYVVIDDSRSATALQHAKEFARANVGLIGLGRGRMTIYLQPVEEPPFCDQLRNRLQNWVAAAVVHRATASPDRSASRRCPSDAIANSCPEITRGGQACRSKGEKPLLVSCPMASVTESCGGV